MSSYKSQSAPAAALRPSQYTASFWGPMASVLKVKALAHKYSQRRPGAVSKELSLAGCASASESLLQGASESLRRIDNVEGLKEMLWEPINLLLVFWPLGIVAHCADWSNAATFWFSFFAMVPLAKILGDATEELAMGLHNDTLGGLLNATFGNAVEMILTVQMLRAAERDPTLIDVVKATLLGSILSNLLLVLGMSFMAGGLTVSAETGSRKDKVQHFSTEAALTNMTMLFLATASFSFPSVYLSEYQYTASDEDVLRISRWCSIYVFISYVCFLVFQLYTHIGLFTSDAAGEGEEDVPRVAPGVAVALLLGTTVLVAVSSEFLVNCIDGLVEDLKGTPYEMGKTFIGVILLPIVGNACEHVGAIRMAMVDKVDITIGIAVGSSTQIGLFVIPFSVIMGWALGIPMDLNFHALNTTVLLFAVLIAFSTLTDGSANWLEGVMLQVTYLIIATLYFMMS